MNRISAAVSRWRLRSFWLRGFPTPRRRGATKIYRILVSSSYTTLHCMITPHFNTKQYLIQPYRILLFPTLLYPTKNYTILYTAWHYTTLHDTTLHCTIIYYTTHYTSQHHTILHYTTPQACSVPTASAFRDLTSHSGRARPDVTDASRKLKCLQNRTEFRTVC